MITEEKLTDQEYDYYKACIRVYNELNGTELEKSLIDLRDQIIIRLGKMDDTTKIQREQGRLSLACDMLDYKNKSTREIARLEELMSRDDPVS